LNRFDREKEQFTHFKNDPNDSTSLSDNKVLTIHEDRNGILWLGTTVGLNKFDKKNKRFIRYHKKDGLPSNSIQGILEDSHGNLWLSTNNGVSKFNPIEETFQNFNESSGLQSNEFCVNSCYKIKNGEMIFGGVNGFNIFHPDSIKKNLSIPPVVFTNFQIFNQDVPIGGKSDLSFTLKKSVTESDSIILSYKYDVILFEFAALNFSYPENNGYAYMMEGFDEDWNYVGNRNFVTYTNLPSGSYNFKVKASNNDGVWNEKGTSLHIIITPPIWAIWWFRILIIIFLIGLIYLIFRIRLHSIQKINRLLEQRVRDRTAELQASNQELEAFAYSVSHDLRTPLRGIQGFSSVILEEYKKKLDNKAKDYLKRITSASLHMDQLIDDLLKLSRVTRINLKKEKINLSDIAEEIISKLKSGKPKRNIQFIIEKKLIANADENLIRLALENLFNNAWKFTSKTPEARIQFKKKKDKNGLVFLIKDNGIGFDMNYVDKLFIPFQRQHKEFEGTGIGLTTVQRIIHRHGGKIWANGKVNKGATFYFTLD
jgi:signal transduction histidine kinase